MEKHSVTKIPSSHSYHKPPAASSPICLLSPSDHQNFFVKGRKVWTLQKKEKKEIAFTLQTSAAWFSLIRTDHRWGPPLFGGPNLVLWSRSWSRGGFTRVNLFQINRNHEIVWTQQGQCERPCYLFSLQRRDLGLNPCEVQQDFIKNLHTMIIIVTSLSCSSVFYHSYVYFTLFGVTYSFFDSLKCHSLLSLLFLPVTPPPHPPAPTLSFMLKNCIWFL